MELSVSFGERLREERERLRLNQTAFAAIGGVTKKTQMLYESGDRFPDVRYLAALQEMGCDARYVITGQRDAPAPEVLTPDEQELLALFRVAPLQVKATVVAGLKGGTAQAGLAPKYAIDFGNAQIGQVVKDMSGGVNIVGNHSPDTKEGRKK